MRKILENPIVILSARLIVGFVFVSFGISKIADPSAFAKEVGNYDLMPLFSLNIIALTLPWIELVVGLMLIFGIRLKANAMLGNILLILFIFMVGIAWARGLDISCGCSSINPQKVGFPKILENSALLFLSILIYLNPIKKLTLDNFAGKQNTELTA